MSRGVSRLRIGARIGLIAISGVLALLAASALVAARGGPNQKQDEPIKLKSTLVQVPVVVSDRGGRYVTGLRQDDFELYEEGVKQQITLFAPIDTSFSVALLLDSSGSTVDQLNEIKLAALAFIDNLSAADRVMVLNFDDSVHIQCEFTNDREQLREAVEAVTPGEYTQVYEAVYTAVWERLKKVEGRKAAIVFTDGIDTASSEVTQDDTLDAIVDTEDVLVYPIRYSTRADVERKLADRDRSRPASQSGSQPVLSAQERSRSLDRTYRAADEYLEQMAELSGGVVERADTLGDVRGAFTKIADELSRQYLLGYYPSDESTGGQERKINVRVSRPGLVVRARPEYRSPQ
jgi:Ca-activated chloride channel family protein